MIELKSLYQLQEEADLSADALESSLQVHLANAEPAEIEKSQAMFLQLLSDDCFEASTQLIERLLHEERDAARLDEKLEHYWRLVLRIRSATGPHSRSAHQALQKFVLFLKGLQNEWSQDLAVKKPKR